jgi:hypothetical protein
MEVPLVTICVSVALENGFDIGHGDRRLKEKEKRA